MVWDLACQLQSFLKDYLHRHFGEQLFQNSVEDFSGSAVRHFSSALLPSPIFYK